ncbi:hypothetical protein CEXT_793741 [Caerostris extrusa]|uniref:Uncharacterized protein n=1 Tax=Caerostris extrusa TaxID=172846 RepID=A0AAV4Y4A2_CAEEX|nr:hypothetical protein CEXT_793741 [Caerostris extrusa]
MCGGWKGEGYQITVFGVPEEVSDSLSRHSVRQERFRHVGAPYSVVYQNELMKQLSRTPASPFPFQYFTFQGNFCSEVNATQRVKGAYPGGRGPKSNPPLLTMTNPNPSEVNSHFHITVEALTVG